MELKKKLAEQQAHLQQLSDHMFVSPHSSSSPSKTPVTDATRFKLASIFSSS